MTPKTAPTMRRTPVTKPEENIKVRDFAPGPGRGHKESGREVLAAATELAKSPATFVWPEGTRLIKAPNRCHGPIASELPAHEYESKPCWRSTKDQQSWRYMRRDDNNLYVLSHPVFDERNRVSFKTQSFDDISEFRSIGGIHDSLEDIHIRRIEPCSVLEIHGAEGEEPYYVRVDIKQEDGHGLVWFRVRRKFVVTQPPARDSVRNDIDIFDDDLSFWIFPCEIKALLDSGEEVKKKIAWTTFQARKLSKGSQDVSLIQPIPAPRTKLFDPHHVHAKMVKKISSEDKALPRYLGGLLYELEQTLTKQVKADDTMALILTKLSSTRIKFLDTAEVTARKHSEVLVGELQFSLDPRKHPRSGWFEGPDVRVKTCVLNVGNFLWHGMEQVAQWNMISGVSKAMEQREKGDFSHLRDHVMSRARFLLGLIKAMDYLTRLGFPWYESHAVIRRFLDHFDDCVRLRDHKSQDAYKRHDYRQLERRMNEEVKFLIVDHNERVAYYHDTGESSYRLHHEDEKGAKRTWIERLGMLNDVMDHLVVLMELTGGTADQLRPTAYHCMALAESLFFHGHYEGFYSCELVHKEDNHDENDLKRKTMIVLSIKELCTSMESNIRKGAQLLSYHAKQLPIPSEKRWGYDTTTYGASFMFKREMMMPPDLDRSSAQGFGRVVWDKKFDFYAGEPHRHGAFTRHGHFEGRNGLLHAGPGRERGPPGPLVNKFGQLRDAQGHIITRKDGQMLTDEEVEEKKGYDIHGNVVDQDGNLFRHGRKTDPGTWKYERQNQETDHGVFDKERFIWGSGAGMKVKIPPKRPGADHA